MDFAIMWCFIYIHYNIFSDFLSSEVGNILLLLLYLIFPGHRVFCFIASEWESGTPGSSTDSDSTLLFHFVILILNSCAVLLSLNWFEEGPDVCSWCQQMVLCLLYHSFPDIVLGVLPSKYASVVPVELRPSCFCFVVLLGFIWDFYLVFS